MFWSDKTICQLIELHNTSCFFAIVSQISLDTTNKLIPLAERKLVMNTHRWMWGRGVMTLCWIFFSLQTIKKIQKLQATWNWLRLNYDWSHIHLDPSSILRSPRYWQNKQSYRVFLLVHFWYLLPQLQKDFFIFFNTFAIRMKARRDARFEFMRPWRERFV